jgi:acetylornithine deacetylase
MNDDATIDLLRELIAIDSVNPGLVPGGAGEARIADFIAARLRAARIDVEIREAAPGRPNVIAIVEGRTKGPSLMLCGHTDTVGVEGMDAPFDPVVRDGRVYGRGAQDMKAGLAAMLSATITVAECGAPEAGRVIVAAVADEEYLSAGADALVIHCTADAAIVCEPTELVVGVGHKGWAWVEITTHGRAAHGSRADEGRDAIAMMGRVLVALEELDRTLVRQPRHPLLGRASLHASLIEGGRELSTYPDRCTLKIERRTVTGEPDDIALQEVEAILERLRAEDLDFRATAQRLFERPAYTTPEGHPLVDLFSQSRGAMTFWTDAAILGAAGIPSVVFGPGGAGLHGIEEFAWIDQTLACRDTLVDVAGRFCR